MSAATESRARANAGCGLPRRVALVISSLALGGAEKTLCVLAGGLARRGCEVHVLHFDTPQATPFFTLDPRVRLRGLDLNRTSASALQGLRANARRVAVLRHSLRQLRPEAVIGFMDSTNVLCLLACLGLGIPVLATEHTDPRRHDIGVLWNTLRRLSYPLAAAVTTQTEAVRRLLPGRCVLLPNPVEPPPGQGPAPAGADIPQGRLLLALGRLAPEKGFDLLLEAFAALAGSRPQWTLVILGEGPERQRLEAQCLALGLEARALLPGAAAEPAAWLRRAELFALPSRFEGFSNALCEALACGVPAVAFDCQSGPAEILRHGTDGLLVPPQDTPALADALGRLMDDDTLRRAMAARAPEVLERFGLEKVLDQWQALLAQAKAEGPHAPLPKDGNRAAARARAAFSHLWRMLRTSGPAPDGPRSLRLLEADGRLKTFLLRFLRVRVSPDALPRLRGLRAPLDERARLFRNAISLLNVNETYKTTGSDRTKLADEMLLGLLPDLDKTGPEQGPLRLLDIGVSDGSASVALLDRLPEGSQAILTDLHPVLYARGPAFLRLFLDARQRLLGVKILGLYLNLSLSLHANALNFETVDTINPLLPERLGIAGIRPFNALADALPEPVQLIKCANVLNRGYFDDAALLAAAANLARSLAEGGFLVISQNNAAYPGGEACFALQKRGARLLLAAQINGHAALPLFEAGLELCGQTPQGGAPCES